MPTFQFTHPVWGATDLPNLIIPLFDVSIHAPRVGCDTYSEAKDLRKGVSIHAPRVGCDPSPSGTEDLRRCFNSRTPCGVRRNERPDFAKLIEFQFTHPVWGATQRQQWKNGCVFVSIHAPRVGCDTTTARWEALKAVSIHAPRVGCDSQTL